MASIVNPQDYLTSVDLRDGFYQIQIHDSDQHFLSFQFQGLYSIILTLCYPLDFAKVLTFYKKTLRPVVTYLRQLGIRLSLYVDDFFYLCKVKIYHRSHRLGVRHITRSGVMCEQ